MAYVSLIHTKPINNNVPFCGCYPPPTEDTALLRALALPVPVLLVVYVSSSGWFVSHLIGAFMTNLGCQHETGGKREHKNSLHQIGLWMLWERDLNCLLTQEDPAHCG